MFAQFTTVGRRSSWGGRTGPTLCIGLPGMDGFAVARHMRSQPELAGVVLVALTGYGSEEDRRQRKRRVSIIIWSSRFTSTPCKS
jgi:hypothetical protein